MSFVYISDDRSRLALPSTIALVVPSSGGQRVDWGPSFFRKSPLFWPIARPAAALEGLARWPSPDELTAAFGSGDRCGDPTVRFEAVAPRPRRGRAPADARYDARIALEG